MDYLVHHGIKGQKWGVRRYQNEDGTLTEAGKKRYLNMSEKKLYKTLKKQIQSKRGSVHGYENKWRRITYIGDNSRKLIEKDNQNEKEYRSSEEYKKYDKKIRELENKYNKEIDKPYSNRNFELLEKLENDYNNLEPPKKNYNSLRFVEVIKSDGRHYLDDYLSKGGKELSIAYIKDLGFNDETAKLFVKKITKINRTLGDV